MEKKPKHCYVVEPLSIFFDVLRQNLYGHSVSFINAAITDDKICEIYCDGNSEIVNTLTFNQFIKLKLPFSEHLMQE